MTNKQKKIDKQAISSNSFHQILFCLHPVFHRGQSASLLVKSDNWILRKFKATKQHQITENTGWKLVKARNKLNQHKSCHQKIKIPPDGCFYKDQKSYEYSIVQNFDFWYLSVQNSCKNTKSSMLLSYQMHPYLAGNLYITCKDKFSHLSNL